MQHLWSQVGSGDVKGNLASLVPAAVKFYSEVLPLSGPPFIGSRAVRRTREQVDEEQFGPIIGHQTLVRYLTVEQRLGAFHAETDIPLLATVFFRACQQYAFLSLTATPAQLEADSGLTADVRAFARRLLDALLPQQRPDLGPQVSELRTSFWVVRDLPAAPRCEGANRQASQVVLSSANRRNNSRDC